MTAAHLADLAQRRSQLLDELFGKGAYQLDDEAPEVCTISTSWAEVRLAYDRRDQWVSATMKPLRVPADISDSYPAHSWLRFLDQDPGTLRKSALDDRQLTDALDLIRPVLELFKDEQRSRDALWFVRGYSAAYGDWASGAWS
jgi:hypothetical protein